MTTAMLAVETPGPDAPYVTTPYFVPARASGLDGLFASHAAWMQLPSLYSDMLRRIRDLVGWSFRDVAEVIGTSHTTVGKLANGTAPTPRSEDAADRIEPLLDILERLSRLVAPGRALTAALEAPGPDGETALGFLREGDWSQALLSAMDVINGPRPARPQLRRGTRRESATHELR